MAQFIAFNQNVEVNRMTVQSVINSMEKGKEERLAILERNGITLEQKEWFLQQDWLNAFKEMAGLLGGMNLFLVGKAIVDNAKFPPIKDLEEALNSLDVAYHMNHRLAGVVMFDNKTGKMIDGIGHYKLSGFNSKDKNAVMICNNPYPSKFDEGIITQLVRRYKPKGSVENIKLDLAKETRTNGGNSCTYLISW